MNKVFLVDDDRYVRKGLLSLIDWADYGFEVCAEADNGEDALEFIKKENPDLVVTDIRMPVLDGLDLIKSTVESTNSNPSFIIISGHSDFTYAQKAVRYGVHDFILKPIDKEEFEQTLQELSEKLNSQKILKKNRLEMIALTTLSEILSGDIDENSAMDYVENLNIKKSEAMQYVIIEVNNMTDDMSRVKDTISDTIRSITQQEFTLLREDGQGCFGCLVTEQHVQPFRGNLEQFATILQKSISLKVDKEISLFVGKTVNNPFHIKESFETAKQALQFKFTNFENTPIYYEKIKQKSVNYIDLDQSFYALLMEHMEENNTELIVKIIDQMIHEFQLKLFARDAVKTSINRSVHEVIKTIKGMGGDEQELATVHGMLHWDDSPFTLAQIKYMFIAFVLEGATLVAKLNKDSAKGNIHKIKKYMETHYQENLTLKSIAKKYYMNPVYMGQLFKKTYGVYFKDFILQVRVNEAKKVIRQTDMRVYEVAESVGFSNADYFVTQFEKIVGMTPTQYRNKVTGKST